MFGGILIIAVVTAYSMPLQILDAALAACNSSFLSMVSSWQYWLCVAPVLVYGFVAVNLWEKAETTTLDFWWNVLYSVRLLTDD